VADTWTEVAPGLYEIADTGSATLADGRILDSNRAGKQIQIYDPATDKWTDGATNPLKSGDENSWASLQNGGVLAVGYQNDGAAIYDPAADKWTRTGPVPSGFNTGDTGGISLMFDGRVFVYGLGQSYIYTPGPSASDPGTWAFGPKLLNGDEAEDEYSDTLPNGKVWGGLVQKTYGPGVILQELDPTTDTVSSVTPPPDGGNPYPIDYVNLPNGQVMVTCERNDWIYTPDTPPQDDWRPTVTSVVFNSGSTYTLTGTQLSGLINGADEGDDMTMAANYPIVWLTDGEAGNVYYCRSFSFSNMMPSKGSAPQTCQFTTPAGLPDGAYSLYVSAVGVQSKVALPFTVGAGGTASGGAGTTGSTAGAGASGAGGAASSGGAGTTGASGATAVGNAQSTGGSSGSGVTANGGQAGNGAAAVATGTGGSPGSIGTGAATKRSGGCGCRAVGGSSRSSASTWTGLGLLALATLRAQRRARKRVQAV
jgi:hypothetical protein